MIAKCEPLVIVYSESVGHVYVETLGYLLQNKIIIAVQMKRKIVFLKFI